MSSSAVYAPWAYLFAANFNSRSSRLITWPIGILFFAKTTLVVPPKTLWAWSLVFVSRELVLRVTIHFLGFGHDTRIVDQFPFTLGVTCSSSSHGK